MGFLGLFSKKQGLQEKTSPAPTHLPSKKSIEDIVTDSNKAIADMQRAAEEYDTDGDIEKQIKVYEKYLLETPLWNSFNFNMSLAKMYEKAGRNDQAWRYLNQLYMWTISPTPIQGYSDKVRYEQFRILKNEKKYKDAFVMLVASFVIIGQTPTQYFNKNKFIREAKTTVKAIGIPEGSLTAFADSLEKDIKAKKLQESQTQAYCVDFFSKYGV